MKKEKEESCPDYTYQRIKTLSNRKKYEILKYSRQQPLTITQISKKIGISYNKTSDYIQDLQKNGLIKKMKIGRTIYITATLTPEFKNI